MIKCFKCHVEKGFNNPKDNSNVYQPPLNFFKFEGQDICAFCYATTIKQEEDMRDEIYEKQHRDTLKNFETIKAKKGESK